MNKKKGCFVFGVVELLLLGRKNWDIMVVGVKMHKYCRNEVPKQKLGKKKKK